MNPSGKPKHGGKRKGAGRPANLNKAARKISQPKRVLGEALKWSSIAGLLELLNLRASFVLIIPINQFPPTLLDLLLGSLRAVALSGLDLLPILTLSLPRRSMLDRMHQLLQILLRKLYSYFLALYCSHFITENDEHADITAGDRIIDESLVNEALDHIKARVGMPEAETHSAEAIDDSELHRQLVATYAEISLTPSAS
ncbi:hypothetical protein B0H17DRAFT_1134001 [Mycena rosella]|uniref:Uncharacterized protein n=1 Tax=Mycena rosella TaxID=1033263 RepID=A0AAD7DGV5_MYCRO|nr:hypothetical protein B0H17DRAFT_1134001 [Mycena rosella]